MCIFSTAVLLWSLTLPVSDKLAPQGTEITIKVCRVGPEIDQIETTYTMNDKQIGPIKVERVCVRDGQKAGEYQCGGSPESTDVDAGH